MDALKLGRPPLVPAAPDQGLDERQPFPGERDGPTGADLAGDEGIARRPSRDRDLDVGVPPGVPADWSRWFPGATPPREPLFSRSGRREGDEDRDRSSSVLASGGRLDLRATDSFSLVRILTWDLAAHLRWIGGPGTGGDRAPLTGATAGRPAPPRFGDPLYWVSLAPLLRLLLHPHVAPRAAVLAHLVEIGDASLTAAGEAASEPSLRWTVSQVHERVRVGREEPPTFEARDGRQRMLARFAQTELLAAEPYDPRGTFGSRLLLFADEVLPILEAFAAEEDATTLRRNATAALARCRTAQSAEALLRIATSTEDEVVLMRALSGLARHTAPLDWEPLLARLRATSDDVQRFAIVGALGRSRSPAVLEDLLRLLKQALQRKDSDLLVATLEAATQLPLGDAAEQAKPLLERVERTMRTSPKAYPPPGTLRGRDADVPDPPGTRGRLLHQLALCALARLDPSDPATVEALVDLVDGPVLARNDPARADRVAELITAVHPPAQLPYLEALGRTRSEKGLRLLRAVARHAEGALGAHALMQLPIFERQGVAEELLLEGETPEQRLVGFEALLADAHEKSTEYARELLAECAELEPGTGHAAQRFLYLRAVRALDVRGALLPGDLLPLLRHTRGARDAFDDLPAEVAELTGSLVETATGTARKRELTALVRELVALVIDNGMNRALGEDRRREAETYVLGLIDDVSAHRSNQAYLAVVRETILAYLLGYRRTVEDPNRAEFSPPVYLEREILLALGRTGEPQAAELLLQVLENPRNAHRAEACLALGMTGEESAAPTLARYLLDEDPFVRFAAYEALRNLDDAGIFVDWMHAPLPERSRAAERTWKWWLEEREG